jgi:hypothetical protein
MNLALIFRFLFAGMGASAKAGVRKPPPSRSAAINRWTGKPHEPKRAKARRLRQIGAT